MTKLIVLLGAVATFCVMTASMPIWYTGGGIATATIVTCIYKQRPGWNLFGLCLIVAILWPLFVIPALCLVANYENLF